MANEKLGVATEPSQERLL